MPSVSRMIIDQQLAEIGIRITPAKMHINLPQLIMRINSESAKMSIDRKDPSFKVNKKKPNSESGLKSAGEFTKSFRDKGKNKALGSISKISGEGEYLSNVVQKGNRVAQLARQNNLKPARIETNLGLMPKSRPEIKWDPGYVRIKWSRYKISIDVEGEYMPKITIDPKHSVEVFLRNKPHFRVTVVEADDPYAPGKHVDQTL